MSDAQAKVFDVAEMRVLCRALASSGENFGFVPTMGALHEGHLTLVRRAVRELGTCVVSIFVNPLQFNDPADLEKYPRDLERDVELLRGVGKVFVVTGTPEEIFGTIDMSSVPRAEPGPSAVGLEGAERPGHFEGVATVVRALFELVRPTRAYFGAKDFQQTLVVRELAARLGYPEIVVCETVREPDGLALSSRNARLTPDARERALTLSRALFESREAWRIGVRRASRLRQILAEALTEPGVDVEYAAIRDPENFSDTPFGRMERAQALVAAKVGGVRLIDNLALDDVNR